MKTELKTDTLRFRVTRDEKERFGQIAGQMELTESKLLRQLIIGDFMPAWENNRIGTKRNVVMPDNTYREATIAGPREIYLVKGDGEMELYENQILSYEEQQALLTANDIFEDGDNVYKNGCEYLEYNKFIIMRRVNLS